MELTPGRFNFRTMNLPPIDKELLAKMGIAPDARPFFPTASFGIDIPREEKKMPPERDLTAAECITMFGKHEAVEMNFIPQMLTALALEQAEQFINYCRDHRLSEFKRHNREMRKCIDEYNRELRQSYGPAWYSYQHYLDRLRETVEADLFKAYCAFTNEASRQYIGREHKDIPARVTFVRMVLTFVEDFDRNIDRLVASRLDMPCHRNQNPWIVLISALCIDIAETFEAKMQITDMMTLCVKILVNRCRQVVREIITEEDAENEK